MKRPAFDACPNCGASMEERWVDCADDDEECDCDIAWDCPQCGKKWLIPCLAHIAAWLSVELSDGREVYVDD